MSKENRLLEIAESQQGYFTSRQAEECGFAPPNFHRKVKSGLWVKERLRGIYRLANYPFMPDSHLVLWTLWSADKHGNPQGVWSHETALSIHKLSDVAPVKLHLSVPAKFRKSTKIPKNLCLHFVDEIPSADVEIRQGYRVTTPVRTLTDVIQEETTQHEQIERSILDLALQKSLFQGILTTQEMEELINVTNSKEMKGVVIQAIDSVWTQAHKQLEDYGRMVEPYTIGLHLKGHGFGTAVLCQYKSKCFLLTAGHIGRALRRAKSVTLFLKFDNFPRNPPAYPAKNFTIFEWDPALDEIALDDVLVRKPKDLAIVVPVQPIIDLLKTYKWFYKMPEEAQPVSLQEALVSMGGIEPVNSESDNSVQLHVGPYAFVASDYLQLPDVDYIVCPVSNQTYQIRNSRRKVISSFEGLSGSGLWKFAKGNPLLAGIAIAQEPSGYNPLSGFRNVYFHGFQSILSALATWEKTHGYHH